MFVSDASTPPERRPCPSCHAMTSWDDNPYRPFCSPRCRMIDLGKWATEEYRVPDAETSSSDNVPSQQKDGEEP
ncbi:MAG: DNA gyrase inhibitor YacG [Deltaproteobacteria bacterium]|nr:DNA gyrase inhibitor YacG [Deltaproteobacteria bacterium]